MKKILIADDAVFMRMMLKKGLTQAGYTEFFEAGDGEEACAIYEQEHPDLVLMDISMPKLNGIDALKKIREFDPDALVVMCSAVGQEAIIIDAVQAGATDFIVKPFKTERLIGAIKTLLV